MDGISEYGFSLAQLTGNKQNSLDSWVRKLNGDAQRGGVKGRWMRWCYYGYKPQFFAVCSSLCFCYIVETPRLKHRNHNIQYIQYWLIDCCCWWFFVCARLIFINKCVTIDSSEWNSSFHPHLHCLLFCLSSMSSVVSVRSIFLFVISYVCSVCYQSALRTVFFSLLAHFIN